mgnify:CR=1 FL=1
MNISHWRSLSRLSMVCLSKGGAEAIGQVMQAQSAAKVVAQWSSLKKQRTWDQTWLNRPKQFKFNFKRSEPNRKIKLSRLAMSILIKTVLSSFILTQGPRKKELVQLQKGLKTALVISGQPMMESKGEWVVRKGNWKNSIKAKNNCLLTSI